MKTFVVAVNGFINPAVDISILTIIVNSEFLLIQSNPDESKYKGDVDMNTDPSELSNE